MRKRLRAAAQAIPFGAPVSATLVARLGTKWTVAFGLVLLAGAVFMAMGLVTAIGALVAVRFLPARGLGDEPQIELDLAAGSPILAPVPVRIRYF